MTRLSNIILSLSLLVVPNIAFGQSTQVTDLPMGPYGGEFRDESTGKVWLDIDTLSGSFAARVVALANTPFRIATAVEVQSLLSTAIIDDPDIGPFLPCPLLPRDPVCKFSVFDDSATGTNPSLFGLAGAFMNQTPTLTNDQVSESGTPLYGTWAIQRAPALHAGARYSSDFDGDSIDEKIVWRRDSATFFVRFSATNEVFSTQWGLPDDTPIVGDYDGDLVPDLVVWRPSNGTWYILTSKSLFDRTQPIVIQFGLTGDIPLRIDNDGDGRLDLTVWRPTSGNFFYVKSSNAQIAVEQWGLPGDVPLTAAR